MGRVSRLTVVERFANTFFPPASWAVTAKEAKTWPFVEAWGGKDMMKKTELLGQDATSLQLDETRQEEQDTNALESVSSLYVKLFLHICLMHTYMLEAQFCNNMRLFVLLKFNLMSFT